MQKKVKLTPKQEQIKKVIRPLVESILIERSTDPSKIIVSIKNFAEDETDYLDPSEQINVFVEVAKYLQDRALMIKRSQG